MSLRIKHISDEKDLKDIYKLRYKIYCYEWCFEKPENHPDEIVSDVFDSNALHFAVKDDTQKIVGAVSLILNSPEGFPTEKYCELTINKNEIPRDSIAEVSRLVIHRDYRRRAEDKYIYGPDEERRSIGSFSFSTNYSNNRSYIRRADDKYKHKGSRRSIETYSERRKRHEVVISLYKAMYQESRRRNITHWYAVMTKGVVILLNKFGFIFKEIGDPVDYHGIRTPYMADLGQVEQEIMQEYPELYEELNKGL